MRVMMVGFIMFILATLADSGTVIYDFEDESQLADWFEVPTLDGLPYTAQWSIENGNLVGFSNDPALGMGQGLGVDHYTWRNYTIEAQFMIEQTFKHPGSWDPAVFLVVHYHLPPGVTDPTQFRMVWLGPHYSVDTGDWKMQWWGSGGGNMRVEDINPPLEEKTWYTARIEAEAGHYRMFFEGMLVGELGTNSPGDSYGVAGFAVRNSEIHFDNVVIQGESIPDVNLAVVSSRSKLSTIWGCIRK